MTAKFASRRIEADVKLIFVMLYSHNILFYKKFF